MAYLKTGHFICSCFKEECNKDCPSYKKFTHKKTNADRIRSMTDEELADFIGGDPMHDICPNDCHDDLDRSCKVCALDWLKEEVSNG